MGKKTRETSGEVVALAYMVVRGGSGEFLQYRFNQLTLPSIKRRQCPFESRECAFVLAEFGPIGRGVWDLLCRRHGHVTKQVRSNLFG
jgi:hypothetical protein